MQGYVWRGSYWPDRGIDLALDHIHNPLTVPASLDTLSAAALVRLRDRIRFRVNVLLDATPASAASPAQWMELRSMLRQGKGKVGELGVVRASLDAIGVLEKARSRGEGAGRHAASA